MKTERLTLGVHFQPGSVGPDNCMACSKALVRGQEVFVQLFLATPWKAEDDEANDYGAFVWHVDCDEGSLAAG